MSLDDGGGGAHLQKEMRFGGFCASCLIAVDNNVFVWLFGGNLEENISLKDEHSTLKKKSIMLI